MRWEPDAVGRLQQAAFELFSELGYEDTTVAEIAARAGLTKRTFFRHFSDKREVLFGGSEQLTELLVTGILEAPESATPMQAASAGLDACSQMFTERHGFAAQRAELIASSPELQERELIKLASMKAAATSALVQRGVPETTAELVAETAQTVFQVGFNRWIAQDDPAAFSLLMSEALEDLREVTAL
ncbi:MAG: TetR family transcriptional regulator [Solirubrobacterales bacterium]|nr:TetR family transcriptional regulator [Solirubrobacterales bacterium]